MAMTPSGPAARPDTHRTKLSVAPRSVGADSQRRPDMQATLTDPPTWLASEAARPGAVTSPRQGVQMAGSDRTSAVRSGDREKALETALVQIERQFGKGSVMRLGDDARAPVEVIPTGSIALDVALGIGGLPRGRVVEIYGPEGSGKTSLALHAIANAQAAGGIAAFIDAEHALDPEYAKKLGVDTDALLVSQPDTGEQALEITDMLIRSGAIDVVVIDSVAALVPRAEIEGEMGDSHVGLQARLMSQALRKLTGAISQTKTTAIFINQLREKVGVMFGSPETTSGGRALKFYASVRLDVRRIETLKDGTEAVGNRIRVKVVKNKVSPPFRQAEMDLLFGHGISREGSLIDLGVEQGIVRKSGAWYTYEGDQLGQGKENARTFLRDNPDVTNGIEKKIKEKLGVGPRLDAEAAVPSGPTENVVGRPGGDK
jgi:recombination protein RecA